MARVLIMVMGKHIIDSCRFTLALCVCVGGGGRGVFQFYFH